MQDSLALLIDHWKADPHSTFNSWFLWEERLKNFRSIRRGIGQVVKDIRSRHLRQCLPGLITGDGRGLGRRAAPDLQGCRSRLPWKPKLRIPDIYENAENQRAFARLLHTCDCCDTAQAVVEAIQRIDTLQIKGLGPAVANLLYFIHPTLVMPFNTAIVKGYNAVTGGNVKLGRWDHHLSMREGRSA